ARIALLEPRRLPPPRLFGQEVLAPQRLHAGGGGPEVSLIQAAPVDAYRSGAHDVFGAKLVKAAELEVAQRLDGIPASGVEALGLPDRFHHRELREQHELRVVRNGVVAQGRPRAGERTGLVRQLADGDTHALL